MMAGDGQVYCLTLFERFKVENCEDIGLIEMEEEWEECRYEWYCVSFRSRSFCYTI